MAAQRDALLAERGGLRPMDFEGAGPGTWVGRVAGVEDVRLPAKLQDYDCRNNRLALLAIETDGFAAAVRRAIQGYGATRIGLFIGTSTSGVQQTELAYAARDPGESALPRSFRYDTTHDMFSVTGFARSVLGLSGPAHVVSTACSSSAKVFGVAQRFIHAGFCDAAVVGGVDSLCLMTLYGFNSLQLVSDQPCRPADRSRNGLTIGEAAGFVLLEPRNSNTQICLLGYGESSDAWHMSTPNPEGAGMARAISSALIDANLEPHEIDYINLHGTATRANDVAEDKAVHGVFKGRAACSSTKGFTGHALGAAGIVEALFSCVAIENGVAFRSLNTVDVDEAIQSPILLKTQYKPITNVMSNSFGFGGSNTSLVLGSPP
jgi:3-oxoacyl-[acyl-carrier-protein] synthase-1